MKNKMYWVEEYDLYENQHEEVDMGMFLFGGTELTDEEAKEIEIIGDLIDEQRELAHKMADRIPKHWKEEAITAHKASIYKASMALVEELLEEMRCYIELDIDKYETAVTEQEDYEDGEYQAYYAEVMRRY